MDSEKVQRKGKPNASKKSRSRQCCDSKRFRQLVELVETTYRVDHEPTTLEAIALTPDGTVHTPQGEYAGYADFLEGCAAAIGIPLGYTYKVSPALFCENFAQRQAETTAPITISRVGNVATGLIADRNRDTVLPAPATSCVPFGGPKA